MRVGEWLSGETSRDGMVRLVLSKRDHSPLAIHHSSLTKPNCSFSDSPHWSKIPSPTNGTRRHGLRKALGEEAGRFACERTQFLGGSRRAPLGLPFRGFRNSQLPPLAIAFLSPRNREMNRDPILFRVDGTPRVGYEHLARCQTLAAALQRRRRPTYF